MALCIKQYVHYSIYSERSNGSPRHHIWKLLSDAVGPDMDLTAQIEQLIRHFDHGEGELDGWQHRLLGWYLEPETLRFLADLDVTFGADEYGQEFSWWQWRQRRRYYSPLKVDDTEGFEFIDTGVDLDGNAMSVE